MSACSQSQFKLSRRNFLVALSSLSLLSLIGCRKFSQPLKIASQVWPGFEFMFLARELGWLNPDEVRLIEVTDATDSRQLLADGLLDGAAFTLDEVLRSRADGVELTVIAVFDFSEGADVLLAKPGIHSLADLKGKRIGVEETALGGLMISKALQLGGLTVDQISIIHSSVQQHERHWQSGAVDALVTYSPVAEQLEQLGAIRLFDSRAIPGSIVDVLAVKSEIIQEYGADLRRFLAAHFRALNYFFSKPEEATLRMAARLAVPAVEVGKMYSGLRLTDLAENYRLLAKNDTPLARTARDLSDQLLQLQLIKRADDMHNLFDMQFLPSLNGAVK